MGVIHMEKRSYDGYCVGIGVEYPGIIVWGENDKELLDRFKAAIPVHKKALKEHGIKQEGRKRAEVIAVDKEMD